MNSLRRHIAIFLLTGLGILQVPAQDTVSIKFSPIKYGNKGFELRDAVGNNLMHLEFRGQFRLAYPTDTDPITENDFQDENLYLGLNRARIKVGGHSYRPWLGYFVEYELQSGYLLDFRLMFTKYPWMKVKVGQWKVQYNRERIISSGKQQTMERSILTRAFTVDRQQGLSLYGHFDGAGAANFNYWISAFMGTGRGNKFNDDKHLMYMSRLQWNILGKPIKFTGSDLEYYKQPSLLIAFGALTNQSPYTRFSAQGGGQLEGFEEEAPGQYRVNQFLGETAFKYRGWGWQQEFHFKQIKDNVNRTTTELVGNLVQLGYLFSKSKPFLWEAYGRYAFYMPDRKQSDKISNETSIGLNWFISKHRFKFTTEVSYLESAYADENIYDGWRYRVQWDVSF